MKENKQAKARQDNRQMNRVGLVWYNKAELRPARILFFLSVPNDAVDRRKLGHFIKIFLQ